MSAEQSTRSASQSRAEAGADHQRSCSCGINSRACVASWRLRACLRSCLMLVPVFLSVFLCDFASPSDAVRTGPRRGRSQRHASEEGTVTAGNYSYFTLSAATDEPVKLTVQLYSLEGDADLYVAGRNQRPSFDVHSHHFQSTTCGKDMVVVPSHFLQEESPVVIGVYGKSKGAL